VVTMFNVPFPYKLPFSKFCNLRCHAFGRLPFLLNQFEPVPLYLELLFILCANFLPFFMLILKAKTLKILLNVSFEKNKNDKHIIFKFIHHKKHVSTFTSSVDSSNSIDIVIAKKNREKRKRKLVKLKTRKGGLSKNERPGGLKT